MVDKELQWKKKDWWPGLSGWSKDYLPDQDSPYEKERKKQKLKKNYTHQDSTCETKTTHHVHDLKWNKDYTHHNKGYIPGQSMRMTSRETKTIPTRTVHVNDLTWNRDYTHQDSLCETKTIYPPGQSLWMTSRETKTIIISTRTVHVNDLT